ncbi:sulfate permease [Microlunatus sp. GCM10028923]|uniref:sulfate permease n=1 Tax=Microlunatus sp. GCM10028923 TaxID=3273400 RepID=UPI00361BFDCD
MISFLWAFASFVRSYLRRFMPTNILLDHLRTSSGLRWGIPAMLLAVPYLAAAYLITVMIDNGAPGWVHLLVVTCVWNALKFVWNGPVSVVLLRRAQFADQGDSKAEGQVSGEEPRRLGSAW